MQLELLYGSTLRAEVTEQPSSYVTVEYEGRELVFVYSFDSTHPDGTVSHSYVQTMDTRKNNADFPNYRLQLFVKPKDITDILIW